MDLLTTINRCFALDKQTNVSHQDNAVVSRVGRQRTSQRLRTFALIVGSFAVGGSALPAQAQGFVPSRGPVASAPTNDAERQLDEQERSKALADGIELEEAGQWGDAIDHYEAATRRFPQDRMLYQRLLISRLRFDVERRYQDQTYLQSLRDMTTSQSLDLYSEILANLQTHYVDTIEWSRVLLHGTAALETALDDETFVQTMLPNTSREQIEKFRMEIHHRISNRSTQSRFDLRATVSQVASMANQELGLSGTATVLEFVSGAVSTLDTYTRLLSPGQLDDMFSTIDGNFVGLGVELKPGEDCLQILSVIPGGPADEAGIKAGDRIMGVDTTSAADRDPDFVADLLRGPEGSSVSLEIASVDQPARRIQVARRRVDVPCVENVHLVDTEAKVGYFRLTNFQKSTPKEVEQALWDLSRQGMRSLIIDLRDNPGGLLPASVEVADRFISTGRILTTRGRNARENFDYTAHRPNTWNVPLAVLIDRNSASASEIFSGAIRDANRGTVVGEKSYGKGSVQGIFRMQAAQFGLCLTTAKFYSPSGRAISRNGVEPHISVPPTYIAARPDESGRLVTELEDDVLQKAIEFLGQSAQ
ncbi:PDZ domain-containing protein [Rhodopirellula sp. JC740]|uniref:PDZ domain-containing protein n=1 Tax=Rhodopirellula halodulae TaxID=2894198 RepID=A0ABS8NMW3_9BACT|nr:MULTISPECIES: S41 family peptidase [unclassified Rhodopirellula]MCC9644924.1 PDZ domain-containing protein [Rhodopirellula sp. JC740]MCC9656541.1 PDZ domain-containing protein [Rhodopirellula sp. JC737]